MKLFLEELSLRIGYPLILMSIYPTYHSYVHVYVIVKHSRVDQHLTTGPNDYSGCYVAYLQSFKEHLVSSSVKISLFLLKVP